MLRGAGPLVHKCQQYIPGRKAFKTVLHQLVGRTGNSLTVKQIALGAFLDIQWVFDDTPYESILETSVCCRGLVDSKADYVNEFLLRWEKYRWNNVVFLLYLFHLSVKHAVHSACSVSHLPTTLKFNGSPVDVVPVDDATYADEMPDNSEIERDRTPILLNLNENVSWELFCWTLFQAAVTD